MHPTSGNVEVDKSKIQIQAIAWPGPFNFAVTDDEKKVTHEVPFGEKGILEAVAWLNEHYEGNYKISRL